jgi:hypothetical protein
MKFHENRSSGSRVVPCGRADGRTEMTKIIVAFGIFANAPKIPSPLQRAVDSFCWKRENRNLFQEPNRKKQLPEAKCSFITWYSDLPCGYEFYEEDYKPLERSANIIDRSVSTAADWRNDRYWFGSRQTSSFSAELRPAVKHKRLPVERVPAFQMDHVSVHSELYICPREGVQFKFCGVKCSAEFGRLCNSGGYEWNCIYDYRRRF